MKQFFKKVVLFVLVMAIALSPLCVSQNVYAKSKAQKKAEKVQKEYYNATLKYYSKYKNKIPAMCIDVNSDGIRDLVFAGWSRMMVASYQNGKTVMIPVKGSYNYNVDCLYYNKSTKEFATRCFYSNMSGNSYSYYIRYKYSPITKQFSQVGYGSYSLKGAFKMVSSDYSKKALKKYLRSQIKAVKSK